MKWFKHDSNAHSDAKLKRLKHKYGIVGYGIYWYCIELIAGSVDKQNLSFELEEDSELIAIDWDLDRIKVQEIMFFMVELGLFENNNGRVTCLKLAKRLDDTNAKNPQIRALIRQINSDKLGETPNNSDKLGETPNNSDKLGETPNNSDQTRLDQTRLDNNKNKAPKTKKQKVKPTKRFVKPSFDQVKDYVLSKNYSINPETFISYYNSNGWKIGRTPMVCWKSTLTTWQTKKNSHNNAAPNNNTSESWVSEMRNDPFSNHIFNGETEQ